VPRKLADRLAAEFAHDLTMRTHLWGQPVPQHGQPHTWCVRRGCGERWPHEQPEPHTRCPRGEPVAAADA
jgi:hypothetical protein